MKFSWNNTSQQPRVVVTAEDPDFDATTLQHWRDEGFEVSYLPFTDTRKTYVHQLHHLADPLELGEKYAIVGQANQCTRCFHRCSSLGEVELTCYCTYSIWRSGRSSPRNGAQAHAEAMHPHSILPRSPATARFWVSAKPESRCTSRWESTRSAKVPFLLVPAGRTRLCGTRPRSIR